MATNEQIQKDIAKLYAKVEGLSVALTNLDEKMTNHVMDAKEVAKELRLASENITKLIENINQSHLQSTESKESIIKLEEKVGQQEGIIKSFQAIVAFVKWGLGFVGATGLVAFLSWLVKK